MNFGRPLLLICFLFLLAQWTLVAEKIKDLAAESIVTTWTAYSWANSQWRESVVAKTITEEYDKDGRIQAQTLSLGKGILFEHTLFEYEETTLSRTVKTDAQNKITRITTYTYSPKAVDLSTTKPDGTVIETERQTLDSSGLVVKSEIFNAEKMLQHVQLFQYDQNGNRLSETTYAPNGSRIYQLISNYGSVDPDGRWTVRTDSEAYSGMRPRPKYTLRRTIQSVEEVP